MLFRSRAEATDAALVAMRSGAHDLALAEARAEAGDPHLLLYPLSTSEGAARGPTATNFSFYRNARLDDLLIRASQIFFRPERQRVYARAQAFLAEEIPWIPLYVRLHWADKAPGAQLPAAPERQSPSRPRLGRGRASGSTARAPYAVARSSARLDLARAAW